LRAALAADKFPAGSLDEDRAVDVAVRLDGISVRLDVRAAGFGAGRTLAVQQQT
jgi:hypothetical protein